MSDARKILDERLAKGEISEEDHERLIGKLSSESVVGASKKLSIPNLKLGGGFQKWIVLGALIALVAGIYFFNSSQKEGEVHVKNVQTSGLLADVITGRLVVEGSGGRVYVWIEYNGRKMCPYRTVFQNDRVRHFKFRCPSKGFWYSIKASRHPGDWVVQYAKPLPFE